MDYTTNKSLKEKHKAGRLRDWAALRTANGTVKNEVLKANLNSRTN